MTFYLFPYLYSINSQTYLDKTQLFIIDSYVYTQNRLRHYTLFNMYLNHLSLSLNHSGKWWSLGDNLTNHLCYADDLCLIALSSAEMQKLLDTC